MKSLRHREPVVTRVSRMFAAYVALDVDDEIRVHAGWEFDEKTQMQEAALVIEIADELFGFTCSQAREAAELAEGFIVDHLLECDADDGECLLIHMPLLIRALREGADQSDAIYRKRKLS